MEQLAPKCNYNQKCSCIFQETVNWDQAPKHQWVSSLWKLELLKTEALGWLEWYTERGSIPQHCVQDEEERIRFCEQTCTPQFKIYIYKYISCSCIKLSLCQEKKLQTSARIRGELGKPASVSEMPAWSLNSSAGLEQQPWARILSRWWTGGHLKSLTLSRTVYPTPFMSHYRNGVTFSAFIQLFCHRQNHKKSLFRCTLPLCNTHCD